MDISSEKVLNKMDALIQQAKHASSHQEQQAYVTAIKALCELLTEHGVQPQIVAEPANNMGDIKTQSISTVTDKPLDIEDANGGSLLDF